MEYRRKPINRGRNRSLEQLASANSALPNIAELIDYGQITIGVMPPVGCVAVASDGHNSLAMLARRRSESLAELLTRLDRAVEKALTDEISIDEINTR